MHLTFRQLETFAEVARQGSMQRAAEAMRLTPPAVSLQIKELEGQVRQRLFDRGGRRLSLTAAGEHFLFQARKLLATLKETEDAMARFSRLESRSSLIDPCTSAPGACRPRLQDVSGHPAPHGVITPSRT